MTNEGEAECCSPFWNLANALPIFQKTGGLSMGCERPSLLCLVHSTLRVHFSLPKTTLEKIYIYMSEFRGKLSGSCEAWDPSSSPVLVKRIEWNTLYEKGGNW